MELQSTPSWFTYIVECSDKTFYCGVTNDLSLRLSAHNCNQGARYTRSRGPVRLVFAQKCSSKGIALRLEAKCKKLSRPQKRHIADFILANSAPRRLETERLVLRPPKPRDLPALVALNQDPEVMRYFPALMSHRESHSMLKRIMLHWSLHSFGVYVLELKRKRSGHNLRTIGLVGLNIISFPNTFRSTIEILWRLRRASWGKGYATEAARVCHEIAKQDLGLEYLCAFTATQNKGSIKVMQNIGLSSSAPKTFCHPSLPKDHPLSKHIIMEKRISKRI